MTVHLESIYNESRGLNRNHKSALNIKSPVSENIKHSNNKSIVAKRTKNGFFCCALLHYQQNFT